MIALILVSLLTGLASAQPSDSFLTDLDRVKATSLTLKNEQEKWHALRAALLSRKMAWTPSASVGVGRLSNPLMSTPSVEMDYWKAEFALNLWNGGSDLNALKSADLSLQAQDLQRLSQDLKVELQAAELIFQVLHSEDVIRSTRELVRMREESHRIVTERYKQGRIPLQEVTKSEIDKSQQETRLRTLEAESLEVQSQLKALLRESLQTKAWPFQPEFRLPTPESQLSPATLQLEKLAFSAQAKHRSLRSKHFASLDLTAAYQEYPLVGPTSRQWSSGILLTVPLWSRYETQAASASAYSLAVTAQSEFEQAQLGEQARREVLQKRVDLFRRNLNEARKNLDRAKGLYNDMVKSFRYGRLSVNDLLLEQNRLIESEMSVSQSQLSFHKIVMESCSLVGRALRNCLN